MNKFKNTIKTLLINLFILIILLAVLLIIKSFMVRAKSSNTQSIHSITVQHVSGNIYDHRNLLFFKLIPNSFCTEQLLKNNKKIKKIQQHIDENGFRKTISNADPKNKSTIFFGDSYTFGYGLEDAETLPSQYAKLTHYNAYNVGINGGSPQHMLMHLQDPDFLKKVPKADYIVYTFIGDHIGRLYGPSHSNDCLYYPRFKLKDKKLIYIPPPDIFVKDPDTRKLFVKIEHNNKVNKQSLEYQPSIDLYIAILKESQRLAKIKYPNAKFIVFDTQNAENIDEQLRENHIKVIMLKDIFPEESALKKYFIIDLHPSAEFWKEYTPKLIKKINIS